MAIIQSGREILNPRARKWKASIPTQPACLLSSESVKPSPCPWVVVGGGTGSGGSQIWHGMWHFDLLPTSARTRACHHLSQAGKASNKIHSDTGQLPSLPISLSLPQKEKLWQKSTWQQHWPPPLTVAPDEDREEGRKEGRDCLAPDSHPGHLAAEKLLTVGPCSLQAGEKIKRGGSGRRDGMENNEI